VEKGLKSAFDIKFVFNRWTLGEDFLTGALKVPADRLNDPSFDLLTFWASRRPTSRPPTSTSAAP
jgi:ribonucleoside-diphosphate reductase alpha chain